MHTWRMLRGALVTTCAGLLCACANESVRRHDLAARAMVESGSATNREQRDIAAPARATASRLYSSADQRWTVSYPGDWTLDDTGRFVKLRKGQAVLGIHTLVHVAGRSLDEVADAAIQSWEREMQKVNVVRRVSRQRVSLAGDVMAIAVVHHIGTGRIGQSRKLVTVVRDRSFLIDAEAYLASWPSHEGDFDQIIGSLKVLD